MFDLRVDLRPSSPVPLYHQISSQVESAIQDGRIAKGNFLPGEIQLAERWGVSRPTARRAIQELVERGMVVRRRGVGTQVVNAEVRRAVKLSSLYDDLVVEGLRPETKVLRCEVVSASDELATDLDLRADRSVLALERIRSTGTRPLAFLSNFLVADLTEGLTSADFEASGLYEVLRRRGVRPLAARQVIGARRATSEEACALGLEPGEPLLTMRRVMQDQSGRRVEVGNHVYDATQYSVEMTLVD